MAMAATAKLTTEMPLSLPPHLLSIPSRKTSFSVFFLKPLSSSLHPARKIPRKLIRTSNITKGAPNHSSSWLNKWPSSTPLPPLNYKNPRTLQPESAQFLDEEAVRPGTSAIDRIVLRLRNLGLGSDDEEEEGEGIQEPEPDVEQATGEEKLGDLLKRDWVRPDMILVEDEEDSASTALPWERSAEEESMEEEGRRDKKRTVKAPTLAELTIEDGELRSLRRMGMTLRERINVPKAGVTKEVLEKIHEKWRKSELVRLKFHEDLAHDMKTGHEIVEVCKLNPNSLNEIQWHCVFLTLLVCELV